MSFQDQPVYVLTSTDVDRIRTLLSMYYSALDRIFDRSETNLYTGDDEVMEDIEFYIKSGAKQMDVEE